MCLATTAKASTVDNNLYLLSLSVELVEEVIQIDPLGLNNRIDWAPETCNEWFRRA
jgi:hypothetical protein